MAPTDRQLAELMQQLRSNAEQMGEAQQQLAQTTTVLKQHIVEQKGVNKRMDRMAGEQESRLRDIEQWRAGIEERLPDTLVDGDKLHADMTAISDTVDGLRWRVASWSGGIAALVMVIGWFVKGAWG